MDARLVRCPTCAGLGALRRLGPPKLLPPRNDRERNVFPGYATCPTCKGARWLAIYPDDEAELDATMREQLTTNPEAGGPRDPAIGPHPRFREMDARRELRLRGLPIPPELRDADPQRNPSGWQGGDT